jgi:hypothetical protein
MVGNQTFTISYRRKKNVMPGRIPKKSPEEKAAAKAKDKQDNMATLKFELESGKIKDFQGIFRLYRASVIAKDLHMSYDTYMKKCANPKLFNGAEIRAWADLMNVAYKILQDLINTQSDEIELKQKNDKSAQ